MPNDTHAMPFWVDVIVKLTPAFVALVVGSVASYVAFLQYKTNRDKFRLELFAKRLEAYEKLQEFFSQVFSEGCVKDPMLTLLWEARYKSRFLFGDEIEEHFDEVWKKAVDMRGKRQKLYGERSLPVGPERNEVCEQESKLLKWMMEQMQLSPKRYARYLKFQ